MTIDRKIKKIMGYVIILTLLWAGIVYAYTSAKNSSIPPCVPKPYDITMDYSAFSPEQQALLREFVEHVDRQFEEVYLRFCTYIDTITIDQSCNMVKTDTIQACNWPDTCDTGDPWFWDDYSDEAPTVTINTAVLELLAKPIDLEHTIDPCATAANEKYLETPILRFRGSGGDSLDLTFEGTLDSTENPHHQIYFLPDQASNGNIIWVFSCTDYDSTGSNRTKYLGRQHPYTGLTQCGIVKNINTEMTRDTIVFATAYSTRHGGSHNGSTPPFKHDRGATALNRYYRSGFAYDLSSSLREYNVSVNWADSSDSYFQDSLWVVSKNDTSFVIGIQWSSTRRRMAWTTRGEFLEDYY